MSWDCQEILHFSAYEYFQWEPSPRAPGWQRKRPFREFLDNVSTLTEYDGSRTQESVLNDPEVALWMSKQKPGRYKPRLWGHTRLINLVMSQIEVATGKPMRRPDIPGEVLRQKVTQNKIKSTLARIGVR